nr:MAG TPA: hypothetical protein [Caudoviricetes sp.]
MISKGNRNGSLFLYLPFLVLPYFVLAEKPLRLTACRVAITISAM